MIWILLSLTVVIHLGHSDYMTEVAIPATARRLEMERWTMEGSDSFNIRIKGGDRAYHETFPWLVGIIIRFGNSRSLCSGSLLSSNRVLTAAHCIRNKNGTLKTNFVEVVLGSDDVYNGGIRLNSSFTVHPDPSIDIAMINLPVQVNFSLTVQPVALPINSEELFVGYTAYAAGFGDLSLNPSVDAKYNQYIDLAVIPSIECNDHKLAKICTSATDLLGNTVGPIFGDSGGPLTVRICGQHILIGVTKAIGMKRVAFMRVSDTLASLLHTSLMASAFEISGYHRTDHYHRNVGIPRATEIREYERRIMENVDQYLDERVYHGYQPEHKQFPWLAGLLIYVGDDLYSFCGGTVITLTRIGTAAHCVNSNFTLTYIRVVLGSDFLYYGGVRTDTDQFVVHPRWIDDPNGNYVDAAIVFLQTAVTFTPTIQPVTLPTVYSSQTFSDYTAYVAGYGLIKDYPKPVYPDMDANQAAALRVLSNIGCNMKDPAVLCTSGEGRIGICHGDSGSGLTVRICSENVWIGIVRGLEKNQCELSYPSQYVRVTEILEFINENLQYEKR